MSREKRYNQAQEYICEILDNDPKLGHKLVCISSALAELRGADSVSNEVIQELIKQRDEAIKLRSKKWLT